MGGGLSILFRHVIVVVLKIRLVEFPGQIVKEKKFTESKVKLTYRKTPLLVSGVDQFSNSNSLVLDHLVA